MTPAQATLHFSYPKAFHRQMLHSVCLYYGLISVSKDNEAGERDTVVFKRATHSDNLADNSRLTSFLTVYMEEPEFEEIDFVL